MGAGRGALILAAGRSDRMGTPKALLPWAGSTLMEDAIGQARAARIDHVVVALGPATAHLASALDAVCVVNPDPETGRAMSIQMAATLIPDDIDALLIQSVDQPVVADIVDALLVAIESGAPVAVPVHGGRRGHPVACGPALVPGLRTLGAAADGLRALLRRQTAIVEVVVDSDAIHWNLNDRAAYVAARDAIDVARSARP